MVTGTILALAVWMISVEIRLARLYEYNDFLKNRTIDIDARTCILEGKKK